MITWSAFAAYMVDNKRFVTASLWAEVARAGKQRVIERQQAGRADSALDFTDLVARVEGSHINGAAFA